MPVQIGMAHWRASARKIFRRCTNYRYLFAEAARDEIGIVAEGVDAHGQGDAFSHHIDRAIAQGHAHIKLFVPCA
jgi:hypothetical protein